MTALDDFKARKCAAAKAKRELHKHDDRIQAAYQATCNGIAINIMDISKVFDIGRRCIEQGADDATLRKGIRDYVELIRQN